MKLTERQTQVLQLIARGHTNKTAAAKLGISAHTVEIHREMLGIKLNLRGTALLTLYAVRAGLVDPAEVLA